MTEALVADDEPTPGPTATTMPDPAAAPIPATPTPTTAPAVELTPTAVVQQAGAAMLVWLRAVDVLDQVLQDGPFEGIKPDYDLDKTDALVLNLSGNGEFADRSAVRSFLGNGNGVVYLDTINGQLAEAGITDPAFLANRVHVETPYDAGDCSYDELAASANTSGLACLDAVFDAWIAGDLVEDGLSGFPVGEEYTAQGLDISVALSALPYAESYPLVVLEITTTVGAVASEPDDTLLEFQTAWLQENALDLVRLTEGLDELSVAGRGTGIDGLRIDGPVAIWECPMPATVECLAEPASIVEVTPIELTTVEVEPNRFYGSSSLPASVLLSVEDLPSGYVVDPNLSEVTNYNELCPGVLRPRTHARGIALLEAWFETPNSGPIARISIEEFLDAGEAQIAFATRSDAYAACPDGYFSSSATWTPSSLTWSPASISGAEDGAFEVSFAGRVPIDSAWARYDRWIVSSLTSEFLSDEAPIPARDLIRAQIARLRASEPEPEPTAGPTPQPEPTSVSKQVEEFSASEQNAIRSAESYLDFAAFSRRGLIEQLEFEGFSSADATNAADSISVSWREQAVLSAENYLEFTSFSCSGLIDQLTFEGFSTPDATYGAEQAGICT